jgi:teichuronic acid biosynthesis glycosyltransferase TuaC
MRILIFSNLWPSSSVPTHGSFIEERWRRIRERTDWELRVMHPLPRYPRVPGKGLAASHARLPRAELFRGVEIDYPRYWHVPRFGTAKHAERMRRGTRRRFARLVRSFKPDLVDAQYLWPDACAAIPLAGELRLPVIATARGSDVNVLPEHPLVRNAMQRILPKATRLLAVSPALARGLASLIDSGQERVIVAPNGVDVSRFEPGGERVRGRVISVARLLPGKALHLLIEALASADASVFRELVLVGDGSERAKLESLARERGVADRVQFVGEVDRDRVAQELGRASLFGFPSRREGWPNAVLEALASGLPILACGIGGIPDIARGCHAVRLLPLEADGAGWGSAITEELHRLGDEENALRSAARRRAEELRWDAVLDPLISIYEQAIAEERSHGG